MSAKQAWDEKWKTNCRTRIKVANEYRKKYESLSQILDAAPELLTLVHRDWEQVLSTSKKGRDGYTSEQLLRALLVMFLEGHGYRDTVVLIDNSEFLQYFVRLGVRSTMDYTFLNKAYNALRAETMDEMNIILNSYAVAEKKISCEKQRMDTTVYETSPATPAITARTCSRPDLF